MAYKWPDLDPDEVADFSVDWGRFLGDLTISPSRSTLISLTIKVPALSVSIS